MRRVADEVADGGSDFLSSPILMRRLPRLLRKIKGGRSPHKNDGPARWARASNYPRPPPRQLLEERVRSVNPATRTTSFRLCRARFKPKTLALVDRHKAADLHNREWFTWSHLSRWGSGSRRLPRGTGNSFPPLPSDQLHYTPISLDVWRGTDGERMPSGIGLGSIISHWGRVSLASIRLPQV